jgi:hypothetical protein
LSIKLFRIQNSSWQELDRKGPLHQASKPIISAEDITTAINKTHRSTQQTEINGRKICTLHNAGTPAHNAD